MIWGNSHRATLLKTSRLARCIFERFEEIGCVLRKARQVMSCTQLADKTGCMPSGATSKLLAFEQDDVCATTQGQVVGNTASDDAATDDYDASISRKFCHLKPLILFTICLFVA
jgi:hypothetical protein